MRLIIIQNIYSQIILFYKEAKMKSHHIYSPHILIQLYITLHIFTIIQTQYKPALYMHACVSAHGIIGQEKYFHQMLY
jgi:hypothetical protein